MEGHGVGDHVGHLGHQPAGAGQGEGRRALAVDDRLERLRPGLAQHGGDQRRVIEARHLVERVVALRQVDRAAPVAQPDVEAVLHEDVDDRSWHRRAVEEVRAHAGAVLQQHGALGGLRVAADVVHGELAPVLGAHAQDAPAQAGPPRALVPLLGREALPALGARVQAGEVGRAGGRAPPDVDLQQRAGEERAVAQLVAQRAAHAQHQGQEPARGDVQDPRGQRGGAVLRVARDPARVEAREQRRRVDPRVVEPAVLDVLDPRERHRAPGAIVGEQAVAHLAPARAVGGDEQVEGPLGDRHALAEAVAVDPAAARRLVLVVGEEALDVVDLEVELERAGRALPPALVVVGGVERHAPAHRLRPLQCAHASSSFAIRSPRAAMVMLGLTPTGPGRIEPSET